MKGLKCEAKGPVSMAKAHELILIRRMARHWFKDWKTKRVETAADESLPNLKVRDKAASVDSRVAKGLPVSL